MSQPCPSCGGDHAAKDCVAKNANWDDPTELGRLPAVGELRPGMVVGEYRLLERAGQGGMGVVWSGMQPLIGRKVAIKILHTGSDSTASARFLKEAQAASRIHHHNIVDVYSFGQLPDGRSYLVMEFLEGKNLADHLKEHGPLPFDAAKPILDGILNGLRASHEKGIIHRDLKPENIWILETAAGEPITHHTVKILDFGLAKLVDQPDGRNSLMTRAGAPLGTPAYMSPEQCRGVLDVDHRSDLYSLGVILYQMFAGRVPFDGESHIDVINHHLSAAPPALARTVGMGVGLVKVIMKALAKRPEDRYQNAGEMRDALHIAGAEGWVPVPWTEKADDPTPIAGFPIPPSEPAAHTTLPDPPSAYAKPLEEAVLIGDLTVQPEFDGDTLILSFHGELDRDDAAPSLARYFDALTEALRDSARRVVLDLEGLSFLGPSALQTLHLWMTTLRDLRSVGMAPVTVRYTTTVRWQATTAATLQRADPSLRLESSD